VTQEQLAEAVGISVDVLNTIERGVNAPPRKALEAAQGRGRIWDVTSSWTDNGETRRALVQHRGDGGAVSDREGDERQLVA
jgi:transcriptional regulator with XRE-family HTH domain